MARKTAQPKIEFRTRGRYFYVLTFRGRVICGAHDMDGINAFLTGWNEAAAARKRAAP